MTDDQLAKELQKLERRRETPLPLIEMFDALPGAPAHSSHHWPRQPFPSGLSGSSAPGVAAAPSTRW
jgi:hypothetical protein